MEQKRKVIPPVYFFLTLVSMAALQWLLPLARIVTPPISYAGIVLIVAGMWLGGHAFRGFSKAGTPVVPFERSTVLVTDGSYRITRNPMYVGMVMILAGIALLLGTVGPWLPIPIFVWVIRSRFILGEERFLEELFGQQYLEYKSRVRRWL
ncbi:MAG TPA: isoprenylcysteine carboxylmethyltransferase family protein [Steroidobacteraceae bacterium]|jgi:protein-S-isoprenylcysteine O-methyltransferase Ste14|nr:isoprenylcysteine carboxylmethyltransferase family protein [Steroidobacteraceae bacterium]